MLSLLGLVLCLLNILCSWGFLAQMLFTVNLYLIAILVNGSNAERVFFLYGSMVSFYSKKQQISNLCIFALQKRAIRVIYKMKSRGFLREHFKETNIRTVISQYIYEFF